MKTALLLLVWLITPLALCADQLYQVYDSDFGVITFKQSGSIVTGTYTHRDGRIEGVLKNGTLTGIWTQSNGRGKLHFSFEPDFATFTGLWSYNEATPDSKWDGTRRGDALANPQQSPLQQAPGGILFQRYQSDFGVITFDQNGAKITGTYPHQDGKIEGMLRGQQLIGKWYQSNGYGKMSFNYSDDFTTFTGLWGYNEAEPTSTWNGTHLDNVKAGSEADLLQSFSSAEIASPAKESISGEHDTQQSEDKQIAADSPVSVSDDGEPPSPDDTDFSSYSVDIDAQMPEWALNLPPLPQPVPLQLMPEIDLRDLGQERYAGMVSLAKEAVAELLGAMGPTERNAYDALWQPMFEFPAPECISYLESVIPLVEQALSLRGVMIENTKQTAELWHAAAIAAHYDQAAAASVMERIHLQTLSLQAHKATFDAILDQLQDLGQPPDPKLLQAAAQERHQRSMRTLESLMRGSVPLEGFHEQIAGLAYEQPYSGDGYYTAELKTPILHTRTIFPLEGSRSNLVLFSELTYREKRHESDFLSALIDDLDFGDDWNAWYAEPIDGGWARYEFDPEEPDAWVEAYFYYPSHDELTVDRYSIDEGKVEASREIFHRAPITGGVQRFAEGETEESIRALLQENRADLRALETEFAAAKEAFMRQIRAGLSLPPLGNPDELYWVLLDVATESLPEPSTQEKRAREGIEYAYQDLQAFSAAPNSLSTTWSDVQVDWKITNIGPQIPQDSDSSIYIANPDEEYVGEIRWEPIESRQIRNSSVHWNPPPALLEDGAFWEINPTLEGEKARFSIQAHVSRTVDDYNHIHLNLNFGSGLFQAPRGLLVLDYPIHADQEANEAEEKGTTRIFESQGISKGAQTNELAVSLRAQRLQQPVYVVSLCGTTPVGYVRSTYTYGQRILSTSEAAKLARELEGSIISASLSEVRAETRHASVEARLREEALEELRALESERRAFHEANIAYAKLNVDRLQKDIETLQSEIRKSPQDTALIEQFNQLRFQWISERSNIICEGDRIHELETGEFRSSRTPFDEMARTQMIQKCEESVRTLSAGVRAQNLAHYLMGKLSPEQRNHAHSIIEKMHAEGKGLYAEDYADLNRALQNLFQGEQELELARIEEEIAWENAFVEGAEYVKTGADIGLTVTSLYGGPAIINIAYHTTVGTIEKDIWEGAKRGIKIYSDAADIMISGYEGWQSGDFWGAVEGASWSTLMNLGPKAAMARLQFSRGFDGGYRPIGASDGITTSTPSTTRVDPAHDAIRAGQFRQEMEWGETLARDYFHDYTRLRTAQIRGDMPADELRNLQMQVRQKASAVSHSMTAKSFLKYQAPPRMAAAHAEIHQGVVEDAIAAFNLEMRQLGFSDQNLRQIRNASSFDLGMDTDIALRENPLLQITRNGQPVSIEEYQRVASRVMANNYKHVSGYDAHSSFVELTTSVHPESYQNLAFLQLPKAGRHANIARVHRIQDRIFGGLDPSEITRDLNVTATKADIMFNQHRELRPLGSLMEASRGTAKDLETKFIPLVETKIRQLQSLPSAQRTPNVEFNLRELENTRQHLSDCHRVMQDIGQGRTHPARWVQDFRQVTGGEDPIAVNRRLAHITQLAAEM